MRDVPIKVNVTITNEDDEVLEQLAVLDFRLDITSVQLSKDVVETLEQAFEVEV